MTALVLQQIRKALDMKKNPFQQFLVGEGAQIHSGSIAETKPNWPLLSCARQGWELGPFPAFPSWKQLPLQKEGCSFPPSGTEGSVYYVWFFPAGI